MTATYRPDIVLVVARADNRVIGKDGAMPWHLSEDLRRFKRITVGKPVIMGRKTFESIGKPLPGRHNIVLTRQPGWRAEGVTVVPNLAEAIAAAGLDPRTRADAIMVVGGADIYAQALPFATRIELTEIHAAPDGDTYFPQLDPARWRETFREAHPAGKTHPAYDFVTLEAV
ncbi:dihydrofolate reductase [Sphingosinicella microcystinivorans]|uniref:dihydrofolate reductase n=1 Tax=Sphingosinicella microcystinivorans TaxID=335406 RepID=UPI0022F37E89|nr:dihydrofolate reductase [Sphingosinicella microcystinivorans]WBX85684.1 dihydrofolate reductase [Sphingosinicella microcystinivorans]